VVRSTAAAFVVALSVCAYALASPAPGPETRVTGHGPALTVHVASPTAGVRFQVRGTVSGALTPGRSQPIALRIGNPHHWPLRVRSLRVRLVGLKAPRAHGGLTCKRADFMVAQFIGRSGFLIPAHQSRTLTALGVAVNRWPRVGMINRHVNQDGCKGASLSLRFSGVAVRASR
jgi:hypothetical protein